MSDARGDIGFGLGERRHEPRVAAEEVGDDGDFSVAGFATAADADGGDAELFGGLEGGIQDDGFENDGEDAGFDERVGSFKKGADLFRGFALFPVASFFNHALGKHAEVAADGDAGVGDLFDFFRLTDAAFELHGVGPGFDEQLGIGQGHLRRFVAVDRKVADDDGFCLRAGDGGGVMEHVRHGDVGGIGIAEHDHTEGVANQQEVDAGFIEKSGSRIVIGR